MKKKTIILDNYDSFTYNLFQYFAECGGEPEVFLNDKITLNELIKLNPTHLVISPGPGTVTNPNDFGVCAEAIKYFAGKIPILGVCLGHQGIAYVFGGSIIGAPEIFHGMRSEVEVVNKSRIFDGLPMKFEVMRYHSYIVNNLPAEFVVTAKTVDDKLIMAFEHKDWPVYGVQFHPESIGTKDGMRMIGNFLGI